MPGMLGDTAASPIDMARLPLEAAALITRLHQQVQTQAREIAWAHAKLEKVNFELARLKRWKFGASTEAMTAQQRALFQETLAEDEASLRAQLAELQRDLPETAKTPKTPPRKPRRVSGARRASPRTAGHHLSEPRVRPAHAAHRRGREREVGHRSGQVLRAPAHL
jgi:hypothetical protein